MRAVDLLLPNSSGWTRRGVVRVATLELAGLSLARALPWDEVPGIKSEGEVLADPVSPGDFTATILDALGVDPQQLVTDASG